MKKKLFLMSLIMVAFVCIFAISAFADDIIAQKTESAEYGTVIRLNADPGLDNAKQYVSTLNKINDAGTDKDALCILTDGDAENPSYYVFPSSYIVDEREDGVFDLIATELASAMAEFNTANTTTYYANYAITGSGGGKRLDAIARFAFPSSVTSANADICCIRSYSKLVEIRMNQSIDFSKAEKMFYSNKKLATFIGFELVDGTKLPKTMFASCSALRYIKLPTNTTKIPGSFFQGAQGVNIVNMEELTQLTLIEAWAFDGTKNLVITLPDSVTTLYTSAFESAFKDGGSITINPTSQLTTIGNWAFSGSAKLSSIYIPSTVTSIGEGAFHSSGITTIENFENCQITVIKKGTFEAASNLTSIKIPETVTTIENAFLGNASLTKVYIPTSVTSVDANMFMKSSWREAPNNLVILCIGKDAGLFANCTRFAETNVISARDYDENGTYTGVNLVVGYSHCVAYNGGVHGESVVDTIVTSYTQPIKVVNKCTLCEMTDESGSIAALFTYRGFSTQEKGGNSIVIGFTSNSAAISEYEEIAGKTLKYGVFAVSQKKLGDSLIFGENGAVASGVINADLTNSDFAMFDLKLTGFNADNMDDKLAMGAYVIATDENGTEYSYLQDSTKGALDGAYYFASYNDMVA